MTNRLQPPDFSGIDWRNPFRPPREPSPPPAPPPGPPGAVQGSAAMFDFFGAQASQARQPQAAGGPRFRAWELRDRSGRVIPGVMRWEWEIYDGRGALNMQQGDLDLGWDRAASSTVDTRHFGHLILNGLQTNATTPDLSGTIDGIWSINIFDRLGMVGGDLNGVGSSTTAAMLMETSATDPTIVHNTFNPGGSRMLGIWPVVLGGATVAERYALGYHNFASEVYSNFTSSPTLAGTFHTDVNPAWGMIQTPLDDFKILIYANAAIRTLKVTDTIATQPTVVLPNLPNGGHDLGLLRLNGGWIKSLRAWWIWPKEDLGTAGMFRFGTEKLGRVVSTDLDGRDPQELQFGLKGIATAALMPDRNGIVATDGERVMFHDGASLTDLHVFTDRTPDSDKEYRCRGFWVIGPRLFYRVNLRASPNGTGNTQEWIEEYDFETGGRHQVTITTTLTATGSLGPLWAGSGPFSKQNNFMHWYSDGSWRRCFVPNYGENPFNMYRKTSGAQASSGQQFALTGVWTTPIVRFPHPVRGLPCLVDEILCLGDVDAGGTGGSVTVAIAVQGANSMSFTNAPSATFRQGDRWSEHLWQAPNNRDAFDRLQVQVTLTQGSDTRMTPNAFPIIIRGLAFSDRRIRTAQEVYEIAGMAV